MNTSGSGMEPLKRAAALAALEEVCDGMIVGLGTGSTAQFVIEELAGRLAGGLRVEAVATSLRTTAAATALGVRILDFSSVAAIDLCIDGVDEIDPGLRAIKGAGGAMLREKIVASAARRMIAVADSSKLVDRLGARAVPVEILPFARSFVELRLRELSGIPALRLAGADLPSRTDQANWVLDVRFATIGDPEALAIALDNCPGILGHGLFLDEIDAIYVAGEAGVSRLERPRTEPD